MGAPSNKKSVLADPSAKAEAVLEYVLADTQQDAIAEKEAQSSIKTELTKKPLVADSTHRQQSRVLFITRDLSVLEQNSLLQLHIKNIASVFNEIHIIVLCESWQARRDVIRIDKNVWTYTTAAKYWWLQTFAAQSIAQKQLRFADGFRPDVVVALDPFESGLCGMAIASTYKREFQVHVTEDFFLPEFIKKEKENKRRLKMTTQVLKHTQSVRTSTRSLLERIAQKFPHIHDIAVLPRHYDIASIIEATKSEKGEDIFPQYSFVALFVGKLDQDSTLYRTLDACRSLLQSPHIALVVVGDGPVKNEFQKRAEILGIQKQVVFQTDTTKLISYLQSADVLICTDTTEASEEIVIKAAASGLPIVAAETPIRLDLFTDGESAFLCPKDDTIGFFHKLGQFINTGALRNQFADIAKDIIKTRLHEDPEAFKRAYRDSIEGVFEA